MLWGKLAGVAAEVAGRIWSAKLHRRSAMPTDALVQLLPDLHTNI